MPDPGIKPQVKSPPAPVKQAGGPIKKTKAKKKVNPAVILCIILVIGIAGFCAAVYFDFGGLKQTLVSVLNLDKPTASQLAEVEAQKKELEVQKQELSKTATEQKKTDSDQKKAASEIEKREKAVTDREAAVQKKEQDLAALEAQLNNKQIDMKATVAMFEKMDSAKAAAAIGGMRSVSDMAMILAGMASTKAGDILNNMDQKIATKVLAAVIAQNKAKP